MPQHTRADGQARISLLEDGCAAALIVAALLGAFGASGCAFVLRHFERWRIEQASIELANSEKQLHELRRRHLTKLCERAEQLAALDAKLQALSATTHGPHFSAVRYYTHCISR